MECTLKGRLSENAKVLYNMKPWQPYKNVSVQNVVGDVESGI